MGVLVALAQSLHADVGVDLRRTQGCVTKKFLHRAKICPTIQQVGCRCVPQSVRAGNPGGSALE